jgi:hypothetical protein
MRGRLNVFQRNMLRWDDLHPYSAAHVVRISCTLDKAQLEHAIDRCLQERGLTGLRLDARQRRFDYRSGSAGTAVKVVRGGPDATAALHREIETQLNTPFAREETAAPFRFFAVDSGEAFHLGIVYDHFVAGGDSIALLLEAIIELCSGVQAVANNARMLELYGPTYRHLLLRHPTYALGALLALPRTVASTRRAARARYADETDHYNAFLAFRLGPAHSQAVVQVGKAWGVTVNDVFLASLLQALAPEVAMRSGSGRRTELSVASIVNIRRDFQNNAHSMFGQFLASFRVSHPVPAGITLRELVRDVHAETTRIKAGKLYVQTIFALALCGMVWPFLSPGQRHRFYGKHHPVWGGVTMLNVNGLWRQATQGAGSEYLRGVSTGPLSPLVFAMTTLGEVIHVGVTFRTSAFSRAAVEGVTARFRRCLESLET